LENKEGIQPESMKPLSGSPPQHGHAAPPTSTEVDDDGPQEEQGFFTSFNMGVMGVMFCLLVFILYKFLFIEIWSIAKAVLGLSFVIFIHELGHFMAAKWCGVNVTTFSIGFGPAIPGCHFTWGETTYKLAILPLGGYVQMVGQVDGDEATDDNDDPRSYRKKTVPQRMLIISAGVIMNAILAVCCFIAIYQGPGKDHAAAVINIVDTSAPAFQKGLQTGGDIIKIDAVENPTFSDFTQMVINTTDHDQIDMTYRTYLKGDPKTFTTKIEPRMDENDQKPIIGVAPPPKLHLVKKLGLQEGPYYAGTKAADAKFEFGDVIIAMTDADDSKQKDAKTYDPARVTKLPDDPRYPNHDQCDYFEFMRRVQLLADKEIVVLVRRKIGEDEKGAKTVEVPLTVAPMYRLHLGVVMKIGPVLAIRENSPAAGKVRTANAKEKLEADWIEAVSVKDADGTEIVWRDKPDEKTEERRLDPERLPQELRRWSDRLDLAEATGRLKSVEVKERRKVTLHLRRHAAPGGEQYKKEIEVLDWDPYWRFDRAAPISLNAPMAIPELGLAYQIKTVVDTVTNPNSPFKKGDVIKNFRYEVDGFEEETPWLRQALSQMFPYLKNDSTDVKVKYMNEDLKEGQWAQSSFQVFQQPYKFKKLFFRIERDKEINEIEVPIELDTSSPLIDRGWHFARDMRRVTASDPLHAIALGAIDTKNRMTEIFLNLRGMVLGRISLKNLGGPLTIAYATYRFAGMDFADFTFFLGLISINLAVVNFLPIPVLDGGHMVFLIYEGIRKKPASESVRVVATYVGLGMIAMLMIFVLSLDALRLFFNSSG
jgi:regulator of sigma E protease